MINLKQAAFLLFVLLYTVFTFSLTDPNLVITGWQPYWQFQQWMWQTFFVNSHLLTYTYSFLITGIVLSYLTVMHDVLKQNQYRFTRATVAVLGLTLLVFSFSYNALSHDVFNYMFNAKMVMVYDGDPHRQVALSFTQDEWVRFMHNTHTPAPYGEGWTALSLFPYALGFEKFIITWLNFRLFSILSLIILLYVYWQANQHQQTKTSWFSLALLVFNPLVLIEIVSNSHNDLWMMLPAVVAILLTATSLPPKKSDQVAKLLLSGILLGLSVSIKFASLALLPLWIGLWILQLQPPLLKGVKNQLGWLTRHWPIIASMLMFIPLFTGRSQLFHPWYLTWSLVWLPFFDWKHLFTKTWAILLIGFSISSLYRYIPWLLAGNFEGTVLLQQQTITWLGGILLTVILYLLREKLFPKK